MAPTLNMKYLEDYLDSKLLLVKGNGYMTLTNLKHEAIEALPFELQRNFSLIRELDAASQSK
jgi:hypothetical protein